MLVNGSHYRTVWISEDAPESVMIIDQRKIPFEFVTLQLNSVQDVAKAIKDMYVRGAGCIGATAGYGMYIAALEAAKQVDFDTHLHNSANALVVTRPTAINLAWAVERQLKAIKSAHSIEEKVKVAREMAEQIADEDAQSCKQIGENGFELIKKIADQKPGEVVNILTHCNAGWLAFVDYGSATAPIYEAFKQGIPVHVWVDETRPRNQGARLTAWELGQAGVPHTIIPDNAGGHLMQNGLVDFAITGADRVTYTGDVANKIGTYLKALAAKDNNVPFYVALPSSTFDWETRDGVKEIPIEQRNQEEVTHMEGLLDGKVVNTQITPNGSPAANYGFDVTPSRLVTGFITERGVCPANEEGVLDLFPEKNPAATAGV